ncbi:MAG: hypothetical protein AAGN66_18730 [Acidobacteriota bacterium]
MTDSGGKGPTAEALDSLLAFLDPDRRRAAEEHERIHRRLVNLFRWRGCADPESLADETMDRVGRRLGEGVEIHASDPYRYFTGVAHRVFHELLRREARDRRTLEGVRREPPPEAPTAEQERRLACLDQCLEGLGDESKGLVLRFYQGEKGERIAGRKRLAADLGITTNALRIRAYRFRARLESCVRGCLSGGGSK